MKAAGAVGRAVLSRAVAFVIFAASGPAAFGATIVVNNLDAGSGLGFDDPTAVAPVAGNPGITRGAQRLNAFEAAAAQWAAMLVSPVTIVVDAQMPAQSCGPSSGVLGSASAQTLHGNFDNAPLLNTWYPQALANSLDGTDLAASNNDISANFNRSVDDDPSCLIGLTWSYVIDAPAPPGTLAFTNTVLHEIGHGLGVAGYTSLSSGQFLQGFPDHYGSFLYSETLGQYWIDLTNAERLTVAEDTGNLTWAGPEVDNVDDFLSAGVQASGRTQMYAPPSISQGSSVNHFDTALTPNELMEPFDTPDNEQLLTNHLLLDVGWKLQLAAAVSITDGLGEILAGDATSYDITIQNDGPGDVRLVDATVSSSIPQLVGATWTCTGSGGGSCGSGNGAGAITDEPVTLPLGASVTFQVDAIVDPTFSGELDSSVTLTTPDNIVNTLSGSDTDATTVLSLGVPAIAVSAITGPTTEAGGTATFTLAAATPPGSPVTVGLTSSNTDEGTVPIEVVLPAASTAAQEVTVTGVDDPLDDGNVGYTIVTAVATSEDGDYDGIDPSDVSVINEDNDYLVGGTVTGPVGSGLVLQNNGGDDLTIMGPGAFTFDTPLVDGAAYLVSLLTPPDESNIQCEVQNGSGTIAGADVISVAVACVETCNIVVVPGQTVNSMVDHEACEVLAVGPDYVAEDGADVFLSSGEEIILLPGFHLDRGATLDAAVCGQSLCETSTEPMPDGCHSCVVEICAVDPFCCGDNPGMDGVFDAICVSEVETVCGLVCE